MKRVRLLILTLAALALTGAARPCGPDFPEAVFVLQTGPGGDYARYAAGNLGIPQQSYRTRSLVIAYDYLNGHPLPPAVQKEAVAVNGYLLDPWSADYAGGKPLPGLDAWLRARAAFGPVDGSIPGSPVTERAVPGEDYSSFRNCLDDAFATAAKTLAARVSAYSAKDPAVQEWVRGQDAVFTDCGDGRVRNDYGPLDKAPAPPPSPRLPAALPGSAPAWLRQDRAYQLAAAHFYRLDFEEAAAGFRAVAADSGSPWSQTARYLIARVYVREATLAARPQGEGADRDAAQRRYHDTLARAQQELLAMRAESRMLPMRGAVDSLLDYVNLRLQPGAQAAVLASRLQAPDAATYRQAVLDLTWLDSGDRGGSRDSAVEPDDMPAWLDAMHRGDEASALQHWRKTRSTAWLVAAMLYAKPGDADAPEMVRAAQAVTKNNPGRPALVYNRLRLSSSSAATRDEVLALLPKVRQEGDPSATNLFLRLSSATAPDLDDWLASVSRTPAGESSDEEGEAILPSSGVNAGAGQTGPPQDTCGKPIPTGTVLALFDTDAAMVLNREMPLRLLAQAAGSTRLPATLRFQVAQAALTRAVLLDRPDIARTVTPALTDCRAAWGPLLADYNAASTPDARQAAGLLALMRFASTVPDVWDGNDRRAGFATYDAYRENWWCSAVPRPGETVDADPDSPAPSATASKAPALPPFLTASDLSEAHAEVARLARVPRASTYFAQQALAWRKEHPADPSTPEILGEAERVLRNSCRKDPPYDGHGVQQANPADMTLTPNLAKALFETLRQNYPNSTWVKRYTTWE